MARKNIVVVFHTTCSYPFGYGLFPFAHQKEQVKIAAKVRKKSGLYKLFLKKAAFFCNFAGLTTKSSKIMHNLSFYEFLLTKKESGELRILFALGLPTQITQWMEICDYHLRHPELSQLKLSLEMGVSKGAVCRAFKLLKPC